VCAYVICEPQVHSSFNLYFLIIKNNRVSYTLKDTFSGFFHWICYISAEYRSSTFTGVKSETSSTQLFVIIKADTEFTSTGVVGISYPPAIINGRRSSTFTGVKLSGFSVPAENYSFRKIYE